jgi:hypothetical protein
MVFRDHECDESELDPIGDKRWDEEFQVQPFRCRVCGMKHECVDGVFDVQFGGV